MKDKLYILAIVLLGISTLFFWHQSNDHRDVQIIEAANTQDKKQTRERVAAEIKLIEEAYKQGLESIDREADSIKKWVLTGKAGTQKTAEALDGFKTKWNYIVKNKKEFEEYVNNEMYRNSHSPKECTNRINSGVWDCLSDFSEIEMSLTAGLAKEMALNEDEAKALFAKVAIDSPSVNADVCNGIIVIASSAIAQAVVDELISSLVIVTVGTGFGAETFGLSLVAGVGVDMLISWMMDTEGNIKKKLDESITKTADLYAEAFKKVMRAQLEARRTQWYATIPELIK